MRTSIIKAIFFLIIFQYADNGKISLTGNFVSRNLNTFRLSWIDLRLTIYDYQPSTVISELKINKRTARILT
jgi:hypothetical protein